FQELAGVRSSHIGNTADLTFSPQKFVIVKRGHLIQMDGVDGNHTAFSQASERRDHDLTAGSKRNRSIEFHWRLFIFRSHPFSSKRSCQLAMRCAASRYIYFAVPRMQDGDGQVCGSSESE